MTVLHKLKYNKQNIIEHLLLMGSKIRLNRIVSKPQHVLFLIDMFYLTYNYQRTPFKLEKMMFIPTSSDEEHVQFPYYPANLRDLTGHY